jgi:hypothetical protein
MIGSNPTPSASRRKIASDFDRKLNQIEFITKVSVFYELFF